MNRTKAHLEMIKYVYGKIIEREYRHYEGRWICTRCSGEGSLPADENYTEGECETCHGWGYIYDVDNILDKLLTLTPEEAPRCPDCDRPNDGTIVIRRSNTAYNNDVSNWDICCLACYDMHQEYWQEDWDDYNSGRL
jgi:RecJ-like exonuclease